jgi:gp16 family phage-associated protein
MLSESPSSESGTVTNRSAGCGFDPKRVAAARKKLDAMNLTIRGWADQNGYSPRLVYKILEGRSACYYGKSHQIAVALGLKDGPRHG